MGTGERGGYLGAMSNSGIATEVVGAHRDASRRDSVALAAALRMVMPLTSLPVAIIAFTVTLTGVALSIGLLPAFLFGVVFFVFVGYLARAMASFERARMRLFLDIEIPTPPARAKGLRAAWTNAPTWRAIGYQIVHLPLAVLSFTITVGGFGTAVALLTMPLWVGHVPAKRANLGLFTISNGDGTAWAVAASGLLVAAVAFGLTYALTAAEGGLARVMLGASARELERRVEVLQESRARVVDAADAERRRIERDLHDGAQQRLVALAMNLGRARARYDDDPGSCARNAGRSAQRRQAGAYRAARPDSWTAPGCADRPRPRRSTIRVGRAVAGSGDARRRGRAAMLADDRGDRLLRGQRNTRERGQACAGNGRASHRSPRPDNAAAGRSKTTASAARTRPPVRRLSGLADRVAGVDGALHIDSPVGGPTVITVELPCAS